MRVLVVYGTKRGGTEGLAAAVGQGLVDAGHTVDVLPARKPLDSLVKWEAVVVGGALDVWFWQRDARRFVKRHLDELQQLPVWFFSSGPLDDSASERELPPPPSVAHLARLAGAQAHKTFGGRLVPGGKTALPTGDWRDLDATRAWGRAVGAQLATMPVRERAHVPQAMSAVHRLVLGLCLFTGITAVGGGLALITSPPRLQGPPAELLEHSPFDSYLIPGLLLFLVIGLGNLAAAALEARRIRGSEVAVLVAGAALTTWIVTQLVMIRTVSWLQLVYFLIGTVTLGAALWLWLVRHRLAPHRLIPRS
ncbi:MAG: flavodoxin domain-containing protein [Archangium sp.]|nr:flavodoxin domain-containing protein [Archangium sp.]MDP3571353.1 flavodoxin domain-containing protein [Archangium sp.]